MKKQSKIMIAVLAALFLATAVFAGLHVATREKVPENALAVHTGKELVYVDMDSFTLVPVQGTLVNGKGEFVPIDAQGVALADVLRKAKLDPTAVQSVTVTAADEFSATLSGTELNEAGKACLIVGEDGWQLIVFGDETMKRSVRKAASIDVLY